MQTTNNILMIRPVDFKFNAETAVNNKFQQHSDDKSVQQQALKEFDDFVSLLRENHVDVIVINDTLEPETPDSIFPNNWISFHENGEVLLYPMYSENRRSERREDILALLAQLFKISEVIDLSSYEEEQVYLEGTGSLVLDRDHQIAYACLSLRTDAGVLDDFCRRTGYRGVIFNAQDSTGFPIYHTNVMMCVATKYAVICLEAVPDPDQQEEIIKNLRDSGKEVITISMDQMNHFAGNMLEIKNNQGASLLVMSEQAYLSLSDEQVSKLKKYSSIVHSPLYTIEKNGGGSARCMLAEIHLEKQ